VVAARALSHVTIEEIAMTTKRLHRPMTILVAVSAVLSASASAQQPGRPGAPAPRARAAQTAARISLDDVAQAMGGRDRILGIRTLVLEGSGDNYNLGQNLTPDASLPRFEVTEYRRSYDFPQRRWRQEQVRVARFTTPNTAPQRQQIALDGDVAFNVLPNGTAQRVGAVATAERVNELFYHPIGLLQQSLDGSARVVPITTPHGRLFRINVGGNEVDLFVDPATRLPVMTLKYVNHPMLGDVLIETEYDDWRDVDGVKLPMHVVQRLDGRWPLSDIRLTSARVNADVGDLAAPADVRSAQPPTPTVSITVDSVARGVWHLTGQSHHSVAIEMRDHLLLVETPQNDARSLAVIARARELRPDKPLRAVINTHHHFDHSGGVRAAISEGLPIITHAGNVAFYRDVARRRFQIAEDALSRRQLEPRIEGVATRRVLSDGTRTVELHHIRGNPHAATLLMVYLPAERLLIQADTYNPPAANVATPPVPVFAPNLVANIDRLGLQVDRVVPIHGAIFPMSTLRAAAQSATGQR
jgi:glyoxylase-like metal-dependent hydrolase (beta-lactamase superfamily II)